MVDFSTVDTSSKLNRLFTGTGLSGMLEGKDYLTFDMVFSFIACFIERATGLFEQAPMTSLHTMYSDLVISLTIYKSGETTEDVRIGERRRHI